MARKQAISKSKDTSRRYPDEFRDEAVQMMLDGQNALPVTVRLGLPNGNMLYRSMQERLTQSCLATISFPGWRQLEVPVFETVA